MNLTKEQVFQLKQKSYELAAPLSQDVPIALQNAQLIFEWLLTKPMVEGVKVD